ncbi:MAG: PEP-CTERM sorting domain-containing protein [Candidatus Zixiibacteriota bacterium]
MKKVLLTVLALMLVSSASAFVTETIYNDWTFNSGPLAYGNLGDNHTYDYASVVDFHSNSWLDYGFDGDWFFNDFSWNHSIPADASGITTAKLYIDGSFIDNANNEISIQGIFTYQSLNNNWIPLVDNDNTLIDLSNVADPESFWVDPLVVSIDYSNTTNFFGLATEYGLRIDESILMMDYDGTPVPEPSTLILIGLGLGGLSVIRRKLR